MNYIKTTCWILTIVGVLIGSYFFIITLIKSNGAPQEAAGAAISLCFVVIPYVLARAIEKINLNVSPKLIALFAYFLWVVFNFILLVNAEFGKSDKATDFFVPFQKEYRVLVSLEYYDWSEFLTYIFAPLIVYGILRFFRRKRTTKEITP